MFNRRDVIYSYDGSFEGLMCCVFESFVRKEIPEAIIVGDPLQLSFSDVLEIETDSQKAMRVSRAIPLKISDFTFDTVCKMFLSCVENKDLLILEFLHKGFKYGRNIEHMLADDTVNTVNKAVFHCTHEAHLLKGFVRFSDYNGYLAAVIEPKNKVIPLLASHFTDRFRNENFLIYDKTHRMALIYFSQRTEIAENIDFELPDANAQEEYYRELWKCFYKTIGIKERYNPRCRMNLMPKRFWSNMTEMRDELGITENSANRILQKNERYN
ncbi:MAG: TIGR03915 family putative DNA repair protein [Oscillospiraceae bacterium]|nr:TIGR03915 family putative DNA repair protein [Oscillospiraceae bacterium]